ncbi:hypothetical protein [Pararhizobium sp. DWP1-1-3]|uniref:hypothetical protein n=1 Tax=Pararhizobium sp. DWP1-1-3 TaxID=2804652 RepID=UPI003CF06DEB
MEQYYFWTVWEWGKSLLAILGLTGLSVTLVVGATFAVFKFLGEKWISQRFAEQLEAYKSEQVRELERLRHKINGVFDRTKRLHDREFELLPDVWAKLVDARSEAGGYLAAFQQYANVDTMDVERLSEFLNRTQFSEAQKKDIKNATDKHKTYVSILERYRYSDVMDKLREANSGLSKNGIFLQPALREQFKKMIDLLHAAVIEHQANQEYNVHPWIRDGATKLKNEGEPLFKEIEESVAARLWDSTTTEV